MRIALIPCGPTEWAEEGRLLGRVELPLAATAQQQCGRWVEQLKPLGVRKLVHGPDELTTMTAELLARQLSVPTKAAADLAEVDLGLWAGLTEGQLKARYATAHRELCEAPLSVNPPEGEALRVATDRLEGCLRKLLRKNGGTPLGVVLRPLSFALAKNALEGGDCSTVWETALHCDEPIMIDAVEREGPAA